MELKRFVLDVERQLAAAAAAGGESADVSERLTAMLEPALRLALLEALGAAASEISREVAPTAVELRLRGGEPEFVVVAPPVEIAADVVDRKRVEGPADPSEAGEVARINLRLPETVKAQVEAAAGRDGTSINAWLVRAVVATLQRSGTEAVRADIETVQGPRRYTGWAR